MLRLLLFLTDLGGVRGLALRGRRTAGAFAMANRAGVVGVLVLSGEATEEDVAALPADALQTPDVIVGSVDELLR